MSLDRRRFLTLGGAACSLGMLPGCDAQGPAFAHRLLSWAERKNEAVERAIYRHGAMNHARAGVQLAGDAFPRYMISPAVPMWNEAERGAWALVVEGEVQQPLRLTLEDLVKLPRVTQRVDHFCVEGWTAVAAWAGPRVSELARLAGVQPQARYVDFLSFDSGYHESWDIESALHPQTLVAIAMDGRFLGPGHGAPARVHSPIKLGYKCTKYLTRVVFTTERTGGYWSDRGYEWYGGV